MVVRQASTSLAPETPSQDVSTWTDTRETAKARKAVAARNVSGRRRLIDPTTCDREYSAEETEFMQAIHEYKRTSGRMFPTWSEVLAVLQGLGYNRATG